MGPRELRESSKPIGIIRNRKQAKMGRKSPKKGISKWGWCKGQQTPKVRDMVIGSRKSERLIKNPWECKNGIGQGCQKKWSGSRMPKGIKWAKEAQDDMRINPIENTKQHELSKGKIRGRPKGGPVSTVKQYMAETIQWHGRSINRPTNQKWKETWAVLKKERPIPKQNPT